MGFFSPVIEISAPLKEKKKILWNSRFYVFIWLGIIFFSIYFETILPILYLLLPNYYGKPIWFLVNVTQHLGAALDKKDHRECTHSLNINPIFSFLYWHMEYHLEHHMFPMVPSYNLKKLHNLIKDQTPTPKEGLWGAYKEIIPAIIKQSKNPNYILKIELPN